MRTCSDNGLRLYVARCLTRWTSWYITGNPTPPTTMRAMTVRLSNTLPRYSMKLDPKKEKPALQKALIE